MQIVTLGGLFLDPRFIFIFLTIILVIINILIGVSMLPKDIRKKRFKVHRFIYYSVLICYCIFLWISYSSSITGWLQYCILVYFLFVIPITRRINITLHAVLASLGLVLLVGMASFSVL
jgi:hypothetical protein